MIRLIAALALLLAASPALADEMRPVAIPVSYTHLTLPTNREV